MTPTTAHFHDKHTIIVSSIAEILYFLDHFPSSTLLNTGDAVNDRTVYLRHGREAYRKDISALRKYLEIVERNVTTESFPQIKYERVPSLAINQYSPLFINKDTDRFEAYLDKVADGKVKISGATLLPNTVINRVPKKASGLYKYQAKHALDLIENINRPHPKN
ncbi:hypothetical protein B0T17DRAFT_621739 [Bombardia bombarda]|uniref:DUF2828 domain-containing protein n=1 Tax=Bombardia bombarda TaxID=252184 RepID=A0AA39XHR8_9PEZI|nr:hypothetical protein B0T17DRAFT_621739 [Bombardia bombarda]